MTKEEKLKEYILSKYNSIREFTLYIDMPYATLSTILKRGIDNATISNIFKICNALNISADALANGEIVPLDTLNTKTDNKQPTDITKILAETKRQLLTDEGLMFNGKPADEESIQSIINAMEVGLELAKRKKK